MNVARPFGTYNNSTKAPMLARVWQSMRVMRRFTTANLQATAEAGESAVRKYLMALRKAGYVRLVQQRSSGRPGSHDVWALVRDSGPVAPIRRADGSGVFDYNANVLWNLQGLPVASAADHDAVARGLLAKLRDGGADGAAS